MDKIEVRGARTHNLKNINLTIPRDKLIVITVLSLVQVNPHWLLIRCTQKVNGVMSNHSRLMRANSFL